MAVIAVVELKCVPGGGEFVAGALTQAIKRTVTFAECRYANVGVNEDDPDHVCIQMIWDNSQAHKDYTAAILVDPKMGPVLEKLAGPPKTTYYTHLAHEE